MSTLPAASSSFRRLMNGTHSRAWQDDDVQPTESNSLSTSLTTSNVFVFIRGPRFFGLQCPTVTKIAQSDSAVCFGSPAARARRVHGTSSSSLRRGSSLNCPVSACCWDDDDAADKSAETSRIFLDRVWGAFRQLCEVGSNCVNVVFFYNTWNLTKKPSKIKLGIIFKYKFSLFTPTVQPHVVVCDWNFESAFQLLLLLATKLERGKTRVCGAI